MKPVYFYEQKEAEFFEVNASRMVANVKFYVVNSNKGLLYWVVTDDVRMSDDFVLVVYENGL